MSSHSFHIFGSLSTLFFFISLYGVFAQLRLIFERKRADKGVGYATKILSLNAFSASFLGYYAFYLYGLALTPWNHYLVWPRMVALALTLWILTEIALDRKDYPSRLVLLVACIFSAFGLLFMSFDLEINEHKRVVSQWLTIAITFILGQGYLHQIRVMYKTQSVGAVSRTMHQLTLLKDIFTVTFGFSMGIEDGWPLILLSGVSGTIKILLLLLYWRISSGCGQSKSELNSR